MDENLEILKTKLNDLGNSFSGIPNSEASANPSNGWNLVFLSYDQIADIFKYYSDIIENTKPKETTDIEKVAIASTITSIDSFVQFSMPNMLNPANFHAGAPAILILIENIRVVVGRVCGWIEIGDANKLPTQLARKLKSLKARINNQIDEEANFAEKIKLINDTNDAAEQLPVTVGELEQAKTDLAEVIKSTNESVSEVEKILDSIRSDSSVIKFHKEETEKLSKQCEDSYRTLTSHGLAASFEERARNLSWSINLWVCGLILALIVGGIIGYVRFSELTELFKTLKPENIQLAWIEILFSALSLGLPLWFAWLATKQIGQRFRLSEDYAFKASVARAYEGFRREAVRFDKETEAKLFNSALSRFDEEPLRFIEKVVHGSPLQEMGLAQTIQSTSAEIKDAVVGGVKAVAEKIPTNGDK